MSNQPTSQTLTAAPGHTRRIYSDPKSFSTMMTRITKQLRIIRKVNKFTMIAGAGNSSLPLLGVLGLRLGLSVIACRKETDQGHHDYHSANGHFVSGKYLIVDDIVASGRTVAGIRSNIQLTCSQNGFPTPECAGIFLYHASTGMSLYTIPNKSWMDRTPVECVPMYALDEMEIQGLDAYKLPLPVQAAPVQPIAWSNDYIINPPINTPL